MSIIEKMLDITRKARELVHARSATEIDADSTAGGLHSDAVLDLAMRVRALAVTIDADRCRELRVVMHEAAARDRAAVAAYRKLAAHLLARARQRAWRTIAVTSAGDGDGRTLTAINLALSLARATSDEIVLLDLDFADPGVCRALGVAPSYELREFFENGSHLRELYFSVGNDNLLIAGSTAASVEPAALMESARCEELLKYLHRGAVNPLILIDMPAIQAGGAAAAILRRVDAVLLVVSAGMTVRSDVALALDRLAGVPIAGIVLNRSDEIAPRVENHGSTAA